MEDPESMVEIDRFPEGTLGESRSLEAARLFTRCVHESNAADYTEEQTDAWAPGTPEAILETASKIRREFAVLARENGSVVGFGTLSPDGSELDMLFVSPDRQRTGIGTRITEALEREAAERGRSTLWAHASLTALPFFESAGFVLVRRNAAVRKGVPLTNWVVRKCIAEK